MSLAVAEDFTGWNEYTDALHHDFYDGSLVVNSDKKPITTYEGLYFYINKTRKAFYPADASGLSPDKIKPHTNIGSNIKELITTNAKAGPAGGDCCADAERYLIESLDPESVSNPGTLSPIIVTDDHKPVGVIKSEGMKLFYGIASDLGAGAVSGAFSRQSLHFLVGGLPAVNHAWKININDTAGLRPIRFSVLAIDKSLRQDLSYGDTHSNIRGSDHSDIVALVQEHFHDAQQLGPAGKPI